MSFVEVVGVFIALSSQMVAIVAIIQSLRERVEEMIVSFLKQHLGHADRPLSILVFAFYILFFIWSKVETVINL